MGRKVLDEAEARRHLEAMSVSGQTLREWSRQHELDGRSLNAWRLALSRRGTPRAKRRASHALVELIPTPSPKGTGARYVVELGGVRVEVGDDFEAATLQRLLAALRPC